jgi:malate dehydrogenase (quinone)
VAEDLESRRRRPHQAKVYSQAAVGAPPMSVPHLDTRVVDGETSLLFGPFATFSPKFLKQGHWWDLITQVRFSNVFSMLKVAVTNLDLLKYLIGELLKTHKGKVEPARVHAHGGCRGLGASECRSACQVMVGGQLKLGTEVVAAADGTIAGLLGASPGASTGAPIMLNLLKTCFPDRWRSGSRSSRASSRATASTSTTTARSPTRRSLTPPALGSPADARDAAWPLYFRYGR